MEQVREVFLLLRSVARAGVDHEFALYSIMLQSPIELLRLTDRVGEIVVAMQDQRRRPGVLDVSDGRTLMNPSGFS